MIEQSSLVSIITPAYNAANYIKATIESVLQQTYQNWEMLIVDDSSTDNTREILKEYSSKDDRIKALYLTKNSGAAVARNTAINAAKGKYIAFLDSDDLWYPDKLATQIQFMKKNQYAFTFTDYDLISQDGEGMDKVMQVPYRVDYNTLLKSNIIGCLTVMLDKEKIGRIQMPNIRTRQDYALWLDILKKVPYAYGLKECLSSYRLVKGSISGNKIKIVKNNWYLYRHIEKLNFFYSIWYFLNFAVFGVLKRIR